MTVSSQIFLCCHSQVVLTLRLQACDMGSCFFSTPSRLSFTSCPIIELQVNDVGSIMK